MRKEYITEILIWASVIFLLSFGVFSAHHFIFIKKHTQTLVFSDVDGIIKGSPVRFLGVVVGHVRNIKIKDGLVHTEILITQPKVTIPPGSAARVEFSGIAGSKSIEILPPETDGGTEIIVRPPIRLQDFLDSLAIYSNVLVALENGLVKLSSENTMEILKRISYKYDFEPYNRALDSALEFEKRANETLGGFLQGEKTVSEWIEKVPTFKLRKKR